MNDRFENDVRETLDAAAARIDQHTRDELARRRRAVFDGVERAASRRWLWVPAGAVAAALVAALLVQPMTGRNGLPVAVADEEEVDMELLLAEESLELYEELEFYEWLGTVGDAG